LQVSFNALQISVDSLTEDATENDKMSMTREFFFFVTHALDKKRFVPGKPFQPSLKVPSRLYSSLIEQVAWN
jgi:hypothetical protein